jgi:hypothetical protein
MPATTTHRPVNLAGVRWVEAGRVATFGAARPGFGVEVIATGELLSSDGVRPSVWGSRNVAAVIAEFPGEMGAIRPLP